MEDIFPNFFNFTSWLPNPSDEDDPIAILSIIRGTDWKQPWLICILIFHCLCFFSNFYFRKNLTYQCTTLVLYTLLALASEMLNEYASIHWESFADDAYFDSAGLFITIIFNIPLLINIFMTVLLALSNAAQDLIQLKKLEISHRIKKET